MRGYRNRHCERPEALLHGSKKVPYVILAKGGNLDFAFVMLNLFQHLFVVDPEINSG
ncbi:hypothetical protein [Rickettsia endosymbiont of Orchestes rusci]|uniref:hypothetical protein n=1 Tax=Rickettsia endosymbiont of Orchestes rusci TaxID=3066250 RepID=UPI00313C0DA9